MSAANRKSNLPRQKLAIFLAIIWSFCIAHCFADMATAHWHLQESGPKRHHHQSESHHSESDRSGAAHDHSSSDHDTDSQQCCQTKIRLSASATLIEEFTPVFSALPQVKSFFYLSEQESKFYLFRSKSRQMHLLERAAPMARYVQTLLSPNAPPARLI